MKTVTVGAGSRILIAFENGFPVAGSHILFIPVAFGTFFDYSLFDILVIGLDGVDVLVTIVTAEVQLDVMEILLVFPGDLLMTTSAGDKDRFFFACHMAIEIAKVHMTTGATVIPVDRRGKFCAEKIIVMAELAVRSPAKGRLPRQKHRSEGKRSYPCKTEK
jgi:hypothetical protein